VRAQYVRDTFMSDLQLALSGTSAHWRFVHFYLNGLYWGITGLHERPDDKFSEEYFGGDAAEYDVLRHNSGNVVAGNNVAYNQMFSLARTGLANPTTFEALQQQIDLQWFIDYMIINFWGGQHRLGPSKLVRLPPALRRGPLALHQLGRRARPQNHQRKPPFRQR
jgi:hypothetical protein